MVPAAVNLLHVSLPSGSHYRQEATRLRPNADATLYVATMANILGVLKSAASEWRNGLLDTLELQLVGIAFERIF
jgi:hypothetical protein